MSTVLAQKIVDTVERELSARKGLGWGECDKAVRKEIRQTLERKVDNLLKKAKANEDKK